MEMKFSKAPWAIKTSANRGVEIRAEDNKPVAEVWLHEDTKANAHLIAAAPELLEELQALVDFVDQYVRAVDAQGYIDSARAAIAKAQGAAK